jgi:protein involved in ribonucleotide reduction
MSGVKIDIKRTGFPVKIGDVELWFDSSLENLRRFFNVDEIAQEKLKEAQEKAKHIHFPNDVNVENIDVKTVDAAFDVNKEFIAAQYDIIFGDGTFKKVYKKYPDIIALEDALDVVGVSIAKRIEELEAERTEKTQAKKAEYLSKKAKKK